MEIKPTARRSENPFKNVRGKEGGNQVSRVHEGSVGRGEGYARRVAARDRSGIAEARRRLHESVRGVPQTKDEQRSEAWVQTQRELADQRWMGSRVALKSLGERPKWRFWKKGEYDERKKRLEAAFEEASKDGLGAYGDRWNKRFQTLSEHVDLQDK